MNRIARMMATALVAISPAAAPAQTTGAAQRSAADFSVAGVQTLVPAHAEGDRQAAIVRFPGGYIAEIHAPVKP